MTRSRSALSLLSLLALAVVLTACCGSTCIKDPPCKPKAAAAAK